MASALTRFSSMMGGGYCFAARSKGAPLHHLARGDAPASGVAHQRHFEPVADVGRGPRQWGSWNQSSASLAASYTLSSAVTWP
jgi:hypothetical protein